MKASSHFFQGQQQPLQAHVGFMRWGCKTWFVRSGLVRVGAVRCIAPEAVAITWKNALERVRVRLEDVTRDAARDLSVRREV